MNASRIRVTAVLLSGTASWLSSIAYAQTASASDDLQLEEIVITGSRVSTNENSPTPLTVLNTEEFLKLQPTTVTDALTLMPALQGPQQGTSSRPGGGQRNGAAAYLNLRNMGDLRTLILMDGQRVIPTINSNQAQVDASIVPQMLLKRVDLVTGGVSAVYGSDGVSGVINFVTDRDFNGLKFQANRGTSSHSDADTWDVGIAAGTRFADDRAHIEFSYQYLEDKGLIDRRDALDRSIYAANIGGAGNGTAANPYFNVPDMRISNATFGGLIISTSTAADLATLRTLNGLSSTAGVRFTSATSLAAFNNGLVPCAGGTFVPFATPATCTVATANVQSGGDGAYYASSSIKHASDAHQAFGRFDFDVTDNIHLFAQLGWSKLWNANQFRSPPFIANNTTGNLQFSYQNPFLWAMQGTTGAFFRSNAPLTGAPSRSLGMNILLLNEPLSQNETDAFVGHVGLEGKFGDTYDWNLTVGKSQSTLLSEDLRNFRRDKFAAATDVVDVGQVTTGTANGQTACRATVTYAGHPANANLAGCVPLNIFGGLTASNNTQALGWLYETTFNEHVTKLETMNAAVSGQPFSTWAGPVNMAVSADWRRIRWDVTSNADPIETVGAGNCNGILLNCTTTQTKWVQNSFGAVSGAKQSVKEGALEIQVPLLRDAPMFQSLSLNGAARLTDYSTSGSVETWKLGTDWHINDDFRIRATRSRDIRAPNLFELFSSVKQNCLTSVQDALTGFATNANCNIERPEPNLTPELSDTITAGVVFTPTFVPGLTMSIDYYKIKVEDVIFLVQGFNPNFLATCASLRGAASICNELVVRNNWTDTSPVTNPVRSTESRFYNIATQNTWGIDFESGYRTEIAGHGFNLRALASYQPKLDYDQGPVGVLTMAGAFNVGTNRFAASPKWRVTGVASFDITEDLTFTWLQRWRSGLRAYYDPAIRLVEADMPSLATATVNLNYKFEASRAGRGEVFLNVRNLFDKYPTSYYSGQVTQPSSQPFFPEGDDTIGRYFTLGVRWQM